MGTHRRRKQKSTDKRQQARFAIELTIYAMLFPLLFVVISLIYPIAKQLIGVATEDLEPVNCRLRPKDYIQEFSQRLHEFLNAPQTLAGSGDPEGSTQSPGPEIYDEDSEVST